MKPTFSKYLFNNYKMTCNLVAGNCEGCRNDRTPGVCGQAQMMFMKQWVQCVDYFIGGENGRKTEDWSAWDSDQQVLEYQIYVRTLFFGKHRLMIFFLLMWKESDQSCFCLFIHIFFLSYWYLFLDSKFSVNKNNIYFTCLFNVQCNVVGYCLIFSWCKHQLLLKIQEFLL